MFFLITLFFTFCLIITVLLSCVYKALNKENNILNKLDWEKKIKYTNYLSSRGQHPVYTMSLLFRGKLNHNMTHFLYFPKHSMETQQSFSCKGHLHLTKNKIYALWIE